MVFLFFFAQMGLLTSFHILFDIPKEDIGNRLIVTNQREREDRQKGYLSRQIVSKGTFDSLARKQASRLSFRVFRVSCLRYLPHCTQVTFPISNRGESCILYRSNLTNAPELRKQASQSVRQSQSRSQSQSNHQANSDTNKTSF